MLRAMDESGFDTLKATRALEAAGFESGQAEAMVTVFGGAVVANAIAGLIFGLQRLLQ